MVKEGLSSTCEHVLKHTNHWESSQAENRWPLHLYYPNGHHTQCPTDCWCKSPLFLQHCYCPQLVEAGHLYILKVKIIVYICICIYITWTVVLYMLLYLLVRRYLDRQHQHPHSGHSCYHQLHHFHMIVEMSLIHCRQHYSNRWVLTPVQSELWGMLLLLHLQVVYKLNWLHHEACKIPLPFLTCCWVANLGTNYTGINNIPLIATDSAPGIVSTHFHSPFVVIWSANQSDVTIVAQNTCFVSCIYKWYITQCKLKRVQLLQLLSYTIEMDHGCHAESVGLDHNYRFLA